MHIVGPSTVSNFRPTGWASEMAEYLMIVLRLLPQYAVGHGAGELQASIFERATCCRLHQRLVDLLCSLPIDSFHEDQRPFAKSVKHCCRGTYVILVRVCVPPCYNWSLKIRFSGFWRK